MKVAVIIPCYKVEKKIISVIEQIPGCVSLIICVDDACPNGTGEVIEKHCTDQRVTVLYNKQNRGVGGAVKAGLTFALSKEVDICVKVDGDGQMDPNQIPRLIAPIVKGSADFTKGNRFYNVKTLKRMPMVRLMGNTALSFINKFVTGYWNIMDPTNGFVAIHTKALSSIDIEDLSERYFFESDLLFNLSLIKAVVVDVGIDALYEDEKSNLSITHSAFTFPPKFFKRLLIRYYTQYVVMNFSYATLALLLGSLFLVFGLIYGALKWISYSLIKEEFAPSGTIMISVLTIIIGMQFLLFFFQYDMSSTPKDPIQSEENNL